MPEGTYEKQMRVLADWIEVANPNAVSVPPDLVWMAATLLQGEKIMWVSSTLDTGMSRPAGEVVIFTEHSITRICRERQGVLTTEVIGRSEIRSLTFVGLPEHEWGSHTELSWPPHARVSLTLADGSTLTVPAGERGLSRETRARFLDFLPTLIANIR
jgi:hypothetical protein